MQGREIVARGGDPRCLLGRYSGLEGKKLTMPEQTPRNSRLLVGLISGTSMDGIDAALVRISGAAEHPHVRLLAFETVPYVDSLRKRLLAIAGGESTTAEELNRLHTVLGAAFGQAAMRVCRRGGVKSDRL